MRIPHVINIFLITNTNLILCFNENQRSMKIKVPVITRYWYQSFHFTTQQFFRNWTKMNLHKKYRQLKSRKKAKLIYSICNNWDWRSQSQLLRLNIYEFRSEVRNLLDSIYHCWVFGLIWSFRSRIFRMLIFIEQFVTSCQYRQFLTLKNIFYHKYLS